jgi:oligo-1,6-glucosidase
MTNVPFASITDFRDIESLNHYRVAVQELGMDPEEVLAALRRVSRDNARTPVQWDDTPQAGFTTGTPWIPVNPNHTWLNAAAQRDDPHSVLAHYRALIRLRHSDPVVVDGDFTMLHPDHPRLYAFERRLDDRRLAVYANLSDEPLEVALPRGAEVLLSNAAPAQRRPDHLGPWEAVVYGLSGPENR